MKLQFEHNYAKKHLTVTFNEKAIIENHDDVSQLRQIWLNNLSGWHSPYKALIDCQNLHLTDNKEAWDDIKKSFERMHKLLSSLFLRKAACFGVQDDRLKSVLPFTVFDTSDEAETYLGIKKSKESRQAKSFRDTITFENHFQQHVVELSFSEDVTIDKLEQIAALKGKLTNNLMQWHSGWSLLIDCGHLSIDQSQFDNFDRMLTFLQGFFLKKTIGYSPKILQDKTRCSYPFQVYRSRHKAAAELEAEGQFSGGDANCSSRRS